MDEVYLFRDGFETDIRTDVKGWFRTSCSSRFELEADGYEVICRIDRPWMDSKWLMCTRSSNRCAHSSFRIDAACHSVVHFVPLKHEVNFESIGL